jgi:tRNA A37 N6-isopentenylltransferase MiaA
MYNHSYKFIQPMLLFPSPCPEEWGAFFYLVFWAGTFKFTLKQLVLAVILGTRALGKRQLGFLRKSKL